MSDVKPMRMSDWNRGPEVPGLRLPPAGVAPSPPPPEEPRTPEKSQPPTATPPTIWQGFDLLRLPMGLLRRWYVPVPLSIIGGIVGILIALTLFHASYSVTVRLIVRNPQSFAVSEQSYSPSKLQPSTLVAAVKSPQVAREVSDRLALNMPPGALLPMIEVSEVKRTEFVDINVTTPWPAKETANFATAWAEEAIRFTRKLQADESVEMKTYLEEQARRNDRELEQVNQKLTAFAEQREIIDVNKEMDQYLKSIADMTVQYEIGRVDLQATDHRLESLRSEIRKHSPTFDDLKKAEIKLQELGEYYTDKNPIYQDELDKVEALRRKVNEELKSNQLNASDFTGTFVGNALYMQIIELEAKRDSLARQTDQLSKMLAEARAKLKELPGVALEIAPLMESSQALRASRDALLKRMQEVEVFENLAPGYYRLFKTPTAKDVVVSGRGTKTILVVVVFAALFGMLGVAIAVGLEFFDQTLRTRAEAEVLLGTKCVYAMPGTKEKTVPYFQQELWAEIIGPLLPVARIQTFWQVCPSPRTDTFWETLLAEAHTMGIRLLVVHLTGEVPKPLEALPRVGPQDFTSLPGSTRVVLWELPVDTNIDVVRQIAATLQSARSTFNEIWLHGNGIVREPASSLARTADRIFLLVTLNAAVRDFWQTQRTLLTDPRPLDGFISMDSKS